MFVFGLRGSHVSHKSLTLEQFLSQRGEEPDSVFVLSAVRGRVSLLGNIPIAGKGKYLPVRSTYYLLYYCFESNLLKLMCKQVLLGLNTDPAQPNSCWMLEFVCVAAICWDTIKPLKNVSSLLALHKSP